MNWIQAPVLNNTSSIHDTHDWTITQESSLGLEAPKFSICCIQPPQASPRLKALYSVLQGILEVSKRTEKGELSVIPEEWSRIVKRLYSVTIKFLHSNAFLWCRNQFYSRKEVLEEPEELGKVFKQTEEEHFPWTGKSCANRWIPDAVSSSSVVIPDMFKYMYSTQQLCSTRKPTMQGWERNKEES